MVTRNIHEGAGVGQVGPAPGSAPEPAPLDDFPGCDPLPMKWEDVVAYEGRMEYWDAASSTAWVLRDAGSAHEIASSVLGEILTRIGLERGSRIHRYGAVYLMERDSAKRPRQVMIADETVYLRPGTWRPRDPAILRGEDPLPDVILEVDHTTDVRRNKLALYEAWGFPEVWVETPDEPSRSRPRGLQAGVTIYLLDGGRFRTTEESAAFPTWTAAAIHAALNEPTLSPRTLAELTRVGRELGRREGTTPDDDPQLGRHRRLAHGAGLRAGRAEGLARQRAFLGRLASHKFDAATAERIIQALAAVDDAERLVAVGDRIIDSTDGREVLASLR